MKIFVPQRIHDTALQRLREIGEVDVFEPLDRCISRGELLDRVRDKDILIALGQIPYNDEVIDAANRCKLIAAMHSTAGFVDIAAATRRDIVVTGIPTDVSRTTAEFTFAMIVGTSWRLAEADRFLREGNWAQNQSIAFLSSRLFGKTLGIVGMGIVGQGVARRARACEMNIVYNKRTRLESARENELGASFRSIEALFAESDVVALTLSLTDSARGLVGQRLLSMMKPTAILINTSRGAVIDEAALEEALRQGRLAGAGLDVHEQEPPEFTPRPRPGLLELPNVLLTPHIGTAARETRLEMANQLVENVLAFAQGIRPPNVLNATL